MNHDSNNQFPNPESQLEAGIAAIVAEPIDQEAIQRVKAQAKRSSANVDLAKNTRESNEVNSPPSDRKPSTQSSRFKNLFWINAIAASLAVAFGAAILFSGNQSAFANAIEKLRSLNSFSFVMTTVTELNSTVEEIEDNLETSTARVHAVADGRARIESDGADVIFGPNGKSGLFIDHNEKQASHVRNEDLEFNYLHWFEKLKSNRIKPVKELGKKTLLGIETEGFVVKDGDDEITIWVDPKTDRLVQVELEQSIAKSSFDVTVKMVLNEFEYDVELDNSLFSLDPPVGYEIVEFVDPMSDVQTEKEFVDGLRYFVETADGKFPKSLKMSEFGSFPVEQQVTDEFMNGVVGIQTLVMMSKEHQYLGAGKELSDERSMVFWYRDLESKKLRAVYSDFTTAEIQESQIPKQE